MRYIVSCMPLHWKKQENAFGPFENWYNADIALNSHKKRSGCGRWTIHTIIAYVPWTDEVARYETRPMLIEQAKPGREEVIPW